MKRTRYEIFDDINFVLKKRSRTITPANKI